VEDRQHRQIARWESRWLALAGLMSLTFVLLIAYNLATEGAHIVQLTQKATPEQILAQDVFANPGVRLLAPGRVQVTQVATAFVFRPSDVRVPVGAEVEFYLTASDVIHGYQIEKTNLNAELIPGQVSRMRYTFDEPGVYRVTCNEYCGIGHHTMLGTVTVLPASQWNAEDAAPAGPAAQADAGGAVDGAGVYQTNCASCHQANGQGVPGAFPPLAGHSAELIADQGRDYLPVVLLYGLQGAIEVQGATYNGVMPGWSQLSDEELAAVTNFVLTEWDDGQLPADVEPYAPAEFAEARGQDLSADDVHQRRTE
jgi:cytochrome c oxidase subunit 2